MHALIIGWGAKRILELGTSYGFSTVNLADAARRTGGRGFEVARADAEAYRAAVEAKGNLQSVLLPIGNGIELSCIWSVAPRCVAQTPSDIL